MPTFTLTLFADFSFSEGKEPLLLEIPRKSKALFAWLALHPDHQHQREKLAGILWPDSNEVQARHSLRQALVSIKKSLPTAYTKIFKTTKDWIFFSSEEVKIDTLCFDQALELNTEESLQEAITLYRGELLEGCNPRSDIFENWLHGFRINYSERASMAMDQYLQILLSKDQYEQAISIATQLISIDALKESAYRALILSHTRLGNQSTGIKWYHRCKKVLKDELDIEPSSKIEKLYQAINKTKTQTDIPQSFRIQRRLNDKERLMYFIKTAIRGIEEHNIGQSFLIRFKHKCFPSVKNEITKLAQANYFVCYQYTLLLTDGQKNQNMMIRLAKLLSRYLFDSTELFEIRKRKGIPQETKELIQNVALNQPILLFVENVHYSQLDLQVLLAELISLIGNSGILLVMTTRLEGDPLGPSCKNTMIGAPLTTIDL